MRFEKRRSPSIGGVRDLPKDRTALHEIPRRSYGRYHPTGGARGENGGIRAQATGACTSGGARGRQTRDTSSPAGGPDSTRLWAQRGHFQAFSRWVWRPHVPRKRRTPSTAHRRYHSRRRVLIRRPSSGLLYVGASPDQQNVHPDERGLDANPMERGADAAMTAGRRLMDRKTAPIIFFR